MGEKDNGRLSLGENTDKSVRVREIGRLQNVKCFTNISSVKYFTQICYGYFD